MTSRVERRHRVRAHWIVLGTLMILLAAALTMRGYLHHLSAITDDSVPGDPGNGQVLLPVLEGKPVIDARAVDIRTSGPPRGTIALTFDDGPDPVWTPKILEVLRRHGVHATFFVVGNEAIAHPDIVRDIVADGDEVGIHTLTHTDLGGAPDWQRALELQGAQQAVIAATGQTTSLLRPPYTSTNRAVTPASWKAIDFAALEGYLTVLSTTDSEDWQRPGVRAIEKNAMAGSADGAVVLMHDGGGDRSQTVAALDALLTTWKADGYRVTSVGSAIGAPDVMRPATGWERTAAGMMVAAVRISDAVVAVLAWALLISGVITLARVVLVMVTAVRHVRSSRRGWPGGDGDRPRLQRVRGDRGGGALDRGLDAPCRDHRRRRRIDRRHRAAGGGAGAAAGACAPPGQRGQARRVEHRPASGIAWADRHGRR